MRLLSIAQVGVQVQPDNPLGVLLQFGMASVVLIVTWLFVQYIRHRDARDERMHEKQAAALDKLSAAMGELTTAVHRFDHTAVAALRGGRPHDRGEG